MPPNTRSVTSSSEIFRRQLLLTSRQSQTRPTHRHRLAPFSVGEASFTGIENVKWLMPWKTGVGLSIYNMSNQAEKFRMNKKII